MKYLEIGNENGGTAYRERWPLFVKAIKEKYPEIQLIANHWQGSYPKDPMPDIVDEHYYNTPEFFMQQAHRYDNYDRKGPKIFVGEYAVTRNGGKGNLRAAIGEAAFMTGMERNSDIVTMAGYAPLFCERQPPALESRTSSISTAHAGMACQVTMCKSSSANIAAT